MPPTRVSPDERAQIVAAIRAGTARNEIARTFSRSPSTISKIAADEGLTFDRAKTEAATKAKQADNRARRAELAVSFLDRANQALAKLDEIVGRMEGETLVYSFGGRDNVYSEHLLDEPPDSTIRHMAAAYKDMIASARSATATVLDIERIDQPQVGHGALEQLVEAIRSARSSG